jgi:signal recognition particle GTPase
VTWWKKPRSHFDAEQSKKLQVKMAKGTFGFDDFLKQMQAVRKMGVCEYAEDAAGNGRTGEYGF